MSGCAIPSCYKPRFSGRDANFSTVQSHRPPAPPAPAAHTLETMCRTTEAKPPSSTPLTMARTSVLPSFVVRGRSSNEGIMAASLSLTNDHRAVVAPTLGRLEEQQQ